MVLHTLLMLLKTAVGEGLPWLALRCCSHSAMAQAAALLLHRRRDKYIRYRGLIFAALIFNVSWVVKDLGTCCCHAVAGAGG